jgi:hypothetical protein
MTHGEAQTFTVRAPDWRYLSVLIDETADSSNPLAEFQTELKEDSRPRSVS